MPQVETEPHIVIPDIHGQYDTLSRVFDVYGPDQYKFVFLGDCIDGPDSRRTISLIRSLGDRAITIAGNHEWVCRNALADSNEPTVDVWRQEIWPKYHRGVIESYGLRLAPDWQLNASRLRDVMLASGDLAWLENLPPYYETDGFVAVHAGPERTVSWAEQARWLTRSNSPEQRLAEEPRQIFSTELARDDVVAPAVADQRTFVTGHFHGAGAFLDHQSGQRRRLATRLWLGEPLLIWRDGDDQILAF